MPEAPYELVERMRASIVVLGPLLARYGRARVALPGGDDFGPRPIDMHLKGLEQLGADVRARARLHRGHAPISSIGARILLEFPSVGATENALMAAVLAKGTTVIDNAAREPEIADLAAFLNRMGAQVLGAGIVDDHGRGRRGAARRSSTRSIPDRIEAATFLAAVGRRRRRDHASTAPGADHMDMLIAEARRDGHAHLADGRRRVGAWRPSGCAAVDVPTLPYPGIATDYKPFFVAHAGAWPTASAS